MRFTPGDIITMEGWHETRNKCMWRLLGHRLQVRPGSIFYPLFFNPKKLQRFVVTDSGNLKHVAE